MHRITSYLISSNNKVLKKLRKHLTRIPALQSLGSSIVYKSYMSDYQYIRMKYKEVFGVYPDLDNPKTFNEKNCWRKLFDRKDIYTSLVDKYEVKRIIAERIGEKFTFRLLGVWDKPEDIDFSTLPEQFVLKVNHAGGVVVCRDKQTFDVKEAIAELKKQQNRDYYIISREWPYKNVKRKIIAEEYMGEDLIDYKNYCFNGKLAYTLVWKNHSNQEGKKPEAHFTGAYDRNWKKTDMALDYPSDEKAIDKPKCYDEMVAIAEKMSEGIPFVRVDCYILNDQPYIGEMTFFPWGGFQRFKDERWNQYLGELELLPKEDNDTSKA